MTSTFYSTLGIEEHENRSKSGKSIGVPGILELSAR